MGDPDARALQRRELAPELRTGAYADVHAGGTPAATPESFADLATQVVEIEHVGNAH